MRRNIKINNLVLKEMKKIYYSNKNEYIDWMGFKITEINKPSYHHITKVEDLKKENLSSIATLSNGAYLGKKSHELLHQIETIDKELYDSWNYIFLVINNMNIYPIEDIWKIVFELQDKSLNLINNNKIYKKTRNI